MHLGDIEIEQDKGRRLRMFVVFYRTQQGQSTVTIGHHSQFEFEGTGSQHIFDDENVCGAVFDEPHCQTPGPAADTRVR